MDLDLYKKVKRSRSSLLLISAFQQPFEGRGVITGAVGNVIDKYCFPYQPVNTEILPGDDQPVSVATQLFIPGDMAGQRKIGRAHV